MSRKTRERRQKARSRKDAGLGESRPAGAGTKPRKAEVAPPRSLNRMGFVIAVTALVALFAVVLFLGPGETPDPDAEPTRFLEPDPEADAVSSLEAWQAEPVRSGHPGERSRFPARTRGRGGRDHRVQRLRMPVLPCRHARSLRQVLETYPEDVALVYKNFPLDLSCNVDMTQQLHAFACRTAVMARCAG